MDMQQYRTLSTPFAFSGVSNIKAYYPHLTSKQIEKSLESSDAYTRSRQVKPPQYAISYTHERRTHLQLDLLEFRKLAGRNRQVNYHLVCIDVFSKYCWTRPLHTKKAHAVAKAFESILNEMGESAEEIIRVTTDRGREFTGAPFQRLLQEKNIKLRHPRKHAVFVERLNRSLKELVSADMTQYESLTYKMDKAVETYNSRIHRAVKMAPRLADKIKNEDAVRYALALYYRKRENKPRKDPKFAVGQLVRVQISPGTFTRSFHDTFGVEIFKIHEVITNNVTPMYKVAKLEGGEVLRERYYATQLQSVEGLSEFKIRRIRRTERRVNAETGETEFLVDWAGLPDSYATYVAADEIRTKKKMRKKDLSQL